MLYDKVWNDKKEDNMKISDCNKDSIISFSLYIYICKLYLGKTFS